MCGWVASRMCLCFRRPRGSLVSLPVRCGHLTQEVLCRPRSRNRPQFLAEISAAPQVEQKQKAFAGAPQILHELQQGTISLHALASLLKHCGKAKDLQQGRLLHSFISRCKYSRNTLLGNCIVHMYGTCGSLQEAREAFCIIPKLNTHSWNIFINACVKCGKAQEALDFFTQMQVKGFKLNEFTYVCSLDACASLTALEMGQMIFSAVVESECEGNLVVGTAIIKMYGQCGVLHDARSVFDGMSQWDVVTWSSMISTCTRNEHGHEAWELYHQMQHACIIPDQIACVCALDACASLRALKEGHQVHVVVLANGYEGDIVVGTALVNMYGKCGSLDKAISVFGQIPQKNLISWNSLMAVCVLNGHGKEALALFHQMQLEGFSPDQVTYISVLNACNSLAALEDGRRMHTVIVGGDSNGDIVLGTAIVKMYGKCGSLDDAKKWFGKMDHQDVISWCAIIAACMQNGHDKDVLRFFHQMQLAGIDSDEAVFVCVLDACGRSAALDKGQKLHTAIIENGYEVDTTVGTALIDMYGKCGSLYNAKTVFRDMPDRNMVTWSAMIASYAHNGCDKEAIDLFQQMQHKNIMPNEVTFRSILTVCSHTGQVVDGMHCIMSASQDKGLQYTMEHCLSMIDLLGRAGHLDAAESLINSISIEKKAMAWSCLLGACRVHGDVECGSRIATHIFELDPENAASYITLSNLYAAAGGRQDDAHK